MLKSMKGFLRLPLPRKRVVIEACIELIMAWFVVRHRPYKTWAGYLNNGSFISGPLGESALQEARIVAHSVNAISGRLGGSVTCLMKVIAARRMLWRRRIGHTINIGVNQAAVGASSAVAHAWLDVGGSTVVGYTKKSDYAVILGEGAPKPKLKTGAAA